MHVAERIERVEAAWAQGEDVGDLLVAILDELTGASERARADAVAEIARTVDRRDHEVGAQIAMLGGALVESGVGAEPLARALVAPVLRAVRAAGRFVAKADALSPARDETDDGDDDDSESADEDDDDAMWFRDRRLASAIVVGSSADDADAVSAFRSLDTWYRPVAATWTRAPAVLVDAQSNDALMGAMEALDRASLGAHWMTTLLHASMGQRFVFLLPEIGLAFAATLDGITDCGQLTVLLSEALAEPLARIGASKPATKAELAVMRGEGPQQLGATYDSTFHLYAWQSADRETLLPVDGRYEWCAPGGTGTHSFPADFEPSSVAPLLGRRVVLVVGPGSGSSKPRFTRLIPATRLFAGLRASVSTPVALDDAELALLSDAIRSGGA